MAEQPIDKNEIINAKALPDIIEGFEKWYDTLSKIDTKIKDIAGKTPKIEPPKNTEDFSKLTAKIEELEAAYKAQVEMNAKLKKAENDLSNARAKQASVLAKKVKLQQSDENTLVKLQRRTDRYKKALKDLAKDEKYNNITKAEATRLRVRLNLQLKEAQKEYKAVEKTVTSLTKEQKKEQELIKAKIAIRNTEVKTLEDAVTANKNLRIVLKSINLTTEEGQLARKNLTDQIDKNTKFINDNTDAYSRQKMNIGNYTESTVEALKETGLFTTGLSGLDSVLNKILARLTLFTRGTRTQTAEIKAGTAAMGGFRKSIRAVGVALKGAGIGLVLAAIAGLVAVFKQGDEGATKLNTTLTYITVTIKVLLNALVDFTKGLGNFFVGLYDQFASIGKRMEIVGLQISKAWTFSSEGLNKINNDIAKLRNEIDKSTGNATKGINQMGSAFSGFGDKIAAGVKEAEKASKAFAATFGIRKEIIGIKDAMDVLNGQFERQNALAEDGTISIRRRIDAMKKADVLEIARAQKAIELARKEQQLVQSEVAQAKANFGFSETEQLEKLADAQRKVSEEQDKLRLIVINQSKVERERLLDLFEQNFELARGVADAQRQLAADGIQDERKNIDDRIANFDRFRDSIMDSTQTALNAFSNLAKEDVFDIDVDFRLDDKMNIFLNDQLLAIDNAEELQKQLQATDLPDVVVKKLAQYLRDFGMSNKAIEKFNRSIRDLKSEFESLGKQTLISDEELVKIRQLNEQYEALVNAGDDPKARESILNSITKLEEEKLAIQKEFTVKRLQNEVNEIDIQLENLERNTPEYERLLKSKADTEIQIENLKFEELKRLADEYKNKQQEDLATLIKNLSKIGSEVGKTFSNFIKSEEDILITSQNNIIKNSKKTIESIKAAATAGTSQSKELILAEEKAIEEAQKRIAAANKRKQRAELISSTLTTFNSAMSGLKPGESPLKAVGQTAATMGGLYALLSSLPSFDVGADRLNASGKGVDGKGGFLAINHPNERILTAAQNKLIGFDTTNNELAKIANYYNKGLLKPISEVNPMIMQNDNTEVLKSINDGFSKINNWNMTIEELFGVISVTVDKSKNGDLYRFNKKFKV